MRKDIWEDRMGPNTALFYEVNICDKITLNRLTADRK